jgi:hypothetical protein
LVLVNKQKEPKKNIVKPTSTKTKGTRKGKADDVNADELTAFLIGVFNLLGGLMGGHWFITEDEAEQISEPLTRILNKMNKKKKSKVNDYMAPMLLITAIGSIIVPRLMITAMEWREKANERKRKQKQLTQFKPSPAETPSPSRSVGGETSGADDREQTGGDNGENAPQFLPTVPSEIGLLFNE